MADNIYNFLGLAMKAGKLVSGELGCEKAIKSGKASLVIVAEDASANTKKKFMDSCGFYRISFCVFGEKEKLGKFLGKGVRSVIAVTDKNFSGRLIRLIEETKQSTGVLIE
ncbi:L7Ae/L30e/S12e/Gadd45 family ribosomal protein [Thermoclostridium stercorarium]|uniref:L7Ae/L30e/S12e/Gadd45 family ribosomal protein n=1 Tax=Thermoclostridium stercorarium TaxID=1510 RepID=UPI000AF31CA4